MTYYRAFYEGLLLTRLQDKTKTKSDKQQTLITTTTQCLNSPNSTIIKT